MTSTISYPSSVRNFLQTPPLNGSAFDYTTADGVRVSAPTYIDLSNNQRKQILNEVRSVAAKSTERDVVSPSGLKVSSSSSMEAAVENYLGLTIANLRNVLFQRGGLPVDLVLKLQEVTGLVFVTEKDFAAAFKEKQSRIKDFLKTYKFDDTTAS